MSAVDAAVNQFKACPAALNVPPVDDCHVAAMGKLFPLWIARTTNLDALASSLGQMACTMQSCRDSVNGLLQAVLGLCQMVAKECVAEVCTKHNDEAKIVALTTKAANCVDATLCHSDLEALKAAFGQNVMPSHLRTVNKLTAALFNCGTDVACRTSTAASVNVSFALFAFTSAGLELGIDFGNWSKAETTVAGFASVFSDLSRAAAGEEALLQMERVSERKRSVAVTVMQWRNRLSLFTCTGLACQQRAVAVSCQTDACRTQVALEVAVTNRLVGMLVRYLLPEVSITGLVLYSLIALACLALFIFAVSAWRDVLADTLLYTIVLGGLLVASALRIAFWIVAISGFSNLGYSYSVMTFFMLDKCAPLFSCSLRCSLLSCGPRRCFSSFSLLADSAWWWPFLSLFQSWQWRRQLQ